MVKRIVVFIAVLSLVFVVARAQEATETPEEEALEREIYTVLDWGDAAFEPVLWYASAEELPARTRGTWRADSLGGLAFADYLHFDEGILWTQIDDVFNEDWFDVSIGTSYEVWRENVRCDLGTTRLIEFSLQVNNIKYDMRYWIDRASAYRVMAAFLVFPADDQDNLQAYAEKLYPDLSSCSGSVG